MSILSRAAVFAGRNFFGTRAASSAIYAGAAAAAVAAGSTTVLADTKEQSFIMLKPVRLCLLSMARITFLLDQQAIDLASPMIFFASYLEPISRLTSFRFLTCPSFFPRSICHCVCFPCVIRTLSRGDWWAMSFRFVIFADPATASRACREIRLPDTSIPFGCKLLPHLLPIVCSVSRSVGINW